ncbi:hypothetical protein SAMN05444000_12845 [Shimia gijangensis]|uniref:Uncharacterized protein n=1 Tax=Shimia gijangensis TaxID=1470563 RepID=A0A1M6SBC1_9RHOB|nr:hypothetical protein SAMN05444000_12845 [Shimia gijangensis]
MTRNTCEKIHSPCTDRSCPQFTSLVQDAAEQLSVLPVETDSPITNGLTSVVSLARR